MDQQLKKGDVFFTEITNLSGYGIYHNTDTLDVYRIEACGKNTNEYISEYQDNNFLIAIKYLGNAIFEEMTTNEKLSCDKLNDSKLFVNNYYYDDKEKSYIHLTYQDYKKYLRNNVTLRENEYDKLLLQYIEHISKYPLAISLDLYEVTEETKKTYLKYSNETRKRFINEAKKNSAIDAIEIIKEVTNNIASKASKEEISNLDHQINEFKRRK